VWSPRNSTSTVPAEYTRTPAIRHPHTRTSHTCTPGLRHKHIRTQTRAHQDSDTRTPGLRHPHTQTTHTYTPIHPDSDTCTPGRPSPVHPYLDTRTPGPSTPGLGHPKIQAPSPGLGQPHTQAQTPAHPGPDIRRSQTSTTQTHTNKLPRLTPGRPTPVHPDGRVLSEHDSSRGVTPLG
jgi:hypothetical protein